MRSKSGTTTPRAHRSCANCCARWATWSAVPTAQPKVSRARRIWLASAMLGAMPEIERISLRVKNSERDGASEGEGETTSFAHPVTLPDR